MERLNTSKCRSCGAPIFFIRTTAGKSMPCNIIAVHYKANDKGKDKVVTKEGAVISCEIIGIGNADGFGYVPHWSTCNAPDKFRKRSDK